MLSHALTPILTRSIRSVSKWSDQDHLCSTQKRAHTICQVLCISGAPLDWQMSLWTDVFSSPSEAITCLGLIFAAESDCFGHYKDKATSLSILWFSSFGIHVKDLSCLFSWQVKRERSDVCGALKPCCHTASARDLPFWLESPALQTAGFLLSTLTLILTLNLNP